MGDLQRCWPTVKTHGDECQPYFPRAVIAEGFFRASDYTMVCGWKGTARYRDVVVGDQVIRNAVWAYDTPKPDAESIRERFAFCSGKWMEVQ